MPPCPATGWETPAVFAQAPIQGDSNRWNQERLLWTWTVNPPSTFLSARLLPGFMGYVTIGPTEPFPILHTRSLRLPQRPKIVQRPDALTHRLGRPDPLGHISFRRGRRILRAISPHQPAQQRT